jgi:cellulose biosynthesis protein BcsQ
MKTSTSGELIHDNRRVYTVGGGKGGTGKSFTTANLGTILAQQGNKVLLVDLDLPLESRRLA